MALRELMGEDTVLGVTLTPSTSNGWSVNVGRDYLGYLHAIDDEQFNIYCCRRGRADDWLGQTDLERGIRRILEASAQPVHEAA